MEAEFGKGILTLVQVTYSMLCVTSARGVATSDILRAPVPQVSSPIHGERFTGAQRIRGCVDPTTVSMCRRWKRLAAAEIRTLVLRPVTSSYAEDT
jgi:hypothetical protein